MELNLTKKPVSLNLLIIAIGMLCSLGAWALGAHGHSDYVKQEQINNIEADLDLITIHLLNNQPPPASHTPHDDTSP